MKKTDSWQVFEKSGDILDYLRYKNSQRKDDLRTDTLQEEDREEKYSSDRENRTIIHERIGGTFRHGSDCGAGGRI